MKELHHGVHCAPEAHALSRCQRRLHPPIEGLHEPPRRRLQEGNDIMMPPSPDPSGPRVSPGARCGEEQSEPWRRLQGGRRRPRASPSPAKAGISPGLTPTPKSCSTEQMDATKCTPPPRGLPQTSPEQRKTPTTAHQDHHRGPEGGIRPTAAWPTTGTTTVPGSGRRRHHRAWGSRWHRRGAQQLAPGATALAHRGSPTIGPPRPRWAERARGRSCSSRSASVAGRQSIPRWGFAALVAGPRDATPPDRRRRPSRRRQG
jgi:hypothetical protein